MNKKCKICRHSQSADIVAVYFATDSLRIAAKIFGLSFKTLHRHITNCLVQIGFDNREKSFQRKLMEEGKAIEEDLNARFNQPRLDMRRPRPKSIIKKPVEFTWSRKAWKGINPIKSEVLSLKLG